MDKLEIFLRHIADREEDFGDIGMYEFITNDLLPKLDQHGPKRIADMFYDYYDEARMKTVDAFLDEDRKRGWIK
jgi:hypothetical protein